MCAIYAFMRYCDDLSDEPRRRARPPCAKWRAANSTQALDGPLSAAIPCWPAFHDTVRRYGIPHQYFHEMIDGVSSDLEPRRIETFDELYRYCYQVASVVGLTIIHIFGFQSRATRSLAEKCGSGLSADQYPARHPGGCRARPHLSAGRRPAPLRPRRIDDLCAPQSASPRFREMMRFEAARARAYYAEAMPLVGLVDRRSRASCGR